MKEFSVITPTGDRPESLGICCKLIENQTQKPKEWIVIDDGVHYNIPCNHPIFSLPFVKYIKRERKTTDPTHTLPVQMGQALINVTTNKVIMMEDDDWYAPDYFEKTNVFLEEYDLVGHQWNMYYFLTERQYFQHQNEQWSSFCSTAFTRQAFSCFNHIKMGNPYIDLSIWKTSPHGIRKHLYRPKKIDVLGIKGLPGRIGITYSSNRNILKAGLKKDEDLKFLESVVGKDITLYEPFSKGN